MRPLLPRACAALLAVLLHTGTGATGADARPPAATAARPAAALADPTRPPAALAAPGGLAAAALPHRANLETARAIAAATRAANPPAPAVLPRLQAVQVPARGQPVALVDGRQVRPGDRIDGRTVLAIDQHGLLLQGPQGNERLQLLAGSPKQAAGSIAETATARYQAAPADAADANTGTTAATNAATTPTTTPTAAVPTPLSLAVRTAP